jgi:hypothetical protein
MIGEAARTAQAADWVVVVVGDTVALTGEGCSTATLEFQGGQQRLLDAVAATGTPMIVVLVQSKPSTLPESALNAAAVIEAFNPVCAAAKPSPARHSRADPAGVLGSARLLRRVQRTGSSRRSPASQAAA